MSKIRSIVAAQSSVGEPEHRGDERSEAARSGGSPTFEPDVVPVVPDSEVPARHARRRFTTAYKLDILRRADACGGHGELGQLLRAEGLYSSHLGTWRQQREAGLMPKTRGRKPTAVDPQLKKLEQENRRLTSRLRRAEASFQKKVSAPTRDGDVVVGTRRPHWVQGGVDRLRSRARARRHPAEQTLHTRGPGSLLTQTGRAGCRDRSWAVK